MPLGRKHLRRSRDAPTGGDGHTQRATSRLGVAPGEVNCLMLEGKTEVQRAVPDTSLIILPTDPRIQHAALLKRYLTSHACICKNSMHGKGFSA